MAKKITKNSKIIIILSIAAVLIVFSTNVLPDMIKEESSTVSDDYNYETTFPVARPPPIQDNLENTVP